MFWNKCFEISGEVLGKLSNVILWLAIVIIFARAFGTCYAWF